MEPSAAPWAPGDALFVGTKEGTIWEVHDGATTHVYAGPGGSVRNLTADDREVRAFTRDGTVSVWQRRTEPLQPGALTNLRVCPSGEVVAVVPWPDPATAWAPADRCP